MHKSGPFLDCWPQLLQGNFWLAAVVDSEMLVGHRVRVTDVTRGFDGVEILLKFLAADTQDDDALAGVVSRAP